MTAAGGGRTRVIGLTGGIASGKSVVAKLLAERGATVIDADLLAREAVVPGSPALGEIKDAFGAAILNQDGTLDRAELGRRVFADPQLRRRLEAIMHPAIGRLAEEKLAELRAAHVPVVFYVAPLLIEAGVAARVDEIWVVFVDRDTQLRRLMARDGIGPDEARRKVAAQMPMEEKRGYGRVVIDNSGTLEELKARVDEVWEREIGSAVIGGW